jgi:urea transport system ATP-binding protein
VTGAADAAPLLLLEDITVSFDGFKALNKLSLKVLKGELHAIIGPNGAGKTTMMDVITGKTRPSHGRAFFDGRNLTRLDETQIARLGIGRKFQRPTVFEQQTVMDNIRLALRSERSILQSLFGKPSPADAARVDEVLERIRLLARRDDLAGALSHGQKQWLEIGMLLAQDPKLLLIDEPVAGMSDAETADTAQLLKDLTAHHTLIVVEHDMKFVRDLEAPVTVLHEGSVLAEGAIDDISADPRVIEVYLGR